jgi:hypothetical protein
VKYLTKWVEFPEEENWTEEPLEHFLGTGEGMIRPSTGSTLMRRRIRGSGCEVESVPFPGEAIRRSRFLMADKTPKRLSCMNEILFSY